MAAFYLVMCFHVASLSWRPATGTVHYTKPLCALELRQITRPVCRCEPYIVVIEQRGAD